MADAFISYSRRDSAFVARLRAELEGRGKDVWLDVDGIRDAEVFPAALRRAIEGSDAFVFVISPDSVRSEFCEQEVAYAVELNKRIVPLALREVAAEEVPDEIRVRNWIPVGGPGFDGGVDRLVRALETDLDWERQHTRLTVKALEWEQAGRDRSFLLRGADLGAAERWLAAGADKRPGPSAIEQEYLIAARAAASRRQRTLVAVSLAVAAVSIGLLVFALISRGEAISARDQAVRAAMTLHSRAVAAESETQLGVDPELSILLAEDAVRISPTSAALFALRAALDASAIRYRLPDAGTQGCAEGSAGAAPAPGAAFDPNGRRVAEGLCDGTIVLADAGSGRVIRRVDVGIPAGPVAYSHDGALLAVIAAHRVLVLDPSTGRIREVGPRNVVAGRIAFSPRADVLAIPTFRGGLELWNLASGHTRTLIRSSGQAPIAALAFSPDGLRLALALSPPSHPGILVLDARTGRVLASSNLPVDDLGFSPDGGELVVGVVPTPDSPNGAVTVLDSHRLALRRVLLELPDVAASATAFSPAGNAVAYGGFDGTAGLISSQTADRSIVRYLGQTARVTQIAFAPNGRLVATASLDGTLRVWRTSGMELASRDVGGAIADMQPVGRGFVALLAPRGLGEVAVQRWLDLGSARATAPLVLSPTTNVDAEFISGDGGLAGLIPVPQQNQIRAPIRVWSVAERRVIATIPPAVAPFGGEPVFNPSGTLIAMNRYAGPRPSASGPHAPTPSLVLVDVRNGRSRVLAGTPCDAGWRSFPFSANGALVAGGTFCGEVSVFDVASRRRVGRPFGIGGEVSQIAFSPDAKQIAVGSWDSTLTVRDVATGGLVKVLRDNTQGVTSVAYSPDGRYLASASLDDTVRIWDTRSFTLLRIIHQPNPPYGLRFAADGRNILTFDNNGVVREWDACTACGHANALLALASEQTTRRLTPQEQQTFATG